MSAISTLDDYIDDLGGTNTTNYTDAKKHRSMSRWAHNITAEVAEVMQDYDFQGEISTHNLVADQREYLFPTDLFKVKRIDLKLDGSNWRRANWLDVSQLGNSFASETDITNKFTNDEPFIELFDESYFIYSGTISNVTGGIKITYDKEIVGQNASGVDITAFSADDDEPNLPEFAQMGLVYGAIIDFYSDNTDSQMYKWANARLYGNEAGRPADIRQIGGLMKQIINYFSNRAPDRQLSMASAYEEEDFS